MEVTRTLDFPRFQIRKPRGEKKIPPSERSVLVSWHSTFSEELKSRSDLRGIHMIRDPRDVLISGARYHLNAPQWREAWLYKPNKKFDGKTYHACLNECKDWPSQLLFEMNHMHLETLNQMTDWDYNLPNWRELRYEEMINDTDMAIFSDAADFLGFKKEEKEVVMAAYWNNSLFGALSKDMPSGSKNSVGRHIKSGAPNQWKSKLPRAVAETYAELFGKQLKTLGYAEDDRWVDECTGPTN